MEENIGMVNFEEAKNEVTLEKLSKMMEEVATLKANEHGLTLGPKESAVTLEVKKVDTFTIH